MRIFFFKRSRFTYIDIYCRYNRTCWRLSGQLVTSLPYQRLN